MNKLFYTAVTSIVFAFSLNALAAKPTSITFEADGVSPDGVAYATYIVKCSDGDLQPLTAWDDRKKWCVGKESTENCSKKQIKAAKSACKAN